MTRQMLTAIALVSVTALVPACSKDNKDAKASPGASSAGATKSGDGKKKLPKKGTGTPKTAKAKKGESGEKPNEKSKKAASSTTDSKDKKKVAGDNPCDDAPDGASECHGNSIYFCADKELWELDCNALMTTVHPDLFSSGSCYDSDEITDCLGTGTSEDDHTEACNSDLSLCCDDEGTCYSH